MILTPIAHCSSGNFIPAPAKDIGWTCQHYCALALQMAGMAPDGEEEENTLKGLLLVGHLNIDPSGREMPWPLPAIGFGNGAHLALANLRCSSDAPDEKAK